MAARRRANLARFVMPGFAKAHPTGHALHALGPALLTQRAVPPGVPDRNGNGRGASRWPRGPAPCRTRRTRPCAADAGRPPPRAPCRPRARCPPGAGVALGSALMSEMALSCRCRAAVLRREPGLLLPGGRRLLGRSVGDGADLLVGGPRRLRLGFGSVLLGRLCLGAAGNRCSCLVARGRAPGAHHVDGATVGRDEAGDVDGVGKRMLA